MIDVAGPGAQHVGIARHKFVDVEYPISALAVRNLPAAAWDMPQTGREIGLARAHKNHVPAPVLVAIGDRKALHGMIPKHAPPRPLGNGQAGDFGAVLGSGDKLARRGGGQGGEKEEG